jgi:flagellar protein FlaJ
LIPEIAFFAHRLFGSKLKRTASRFGGLEASLNKSDLALPVEIYFSFMMLICGIVFLAAALNGFVILFVILKSSFLAAALTLPVGLLIAMIAFVFLYRYPGLTASKKRRAVEESLPYAVTFMSILSSAGVPPDRLFRTLATLEQKKQIGMGGEAKLIFRNMEALGEDMVSVLKSISARKISAYLSSLMEGMVSTINSGGALTGYLEEEGKSLMRLRRSILKEFIDTMTLISEMFMALMVAFPLILIVMFVVMSSIGGGVGGISPDTIVPIIIYGLVPAVGLVVLLMIDSITPR